MSIWPDPLVELASRSECVYFIGAGFSKNATVPNGGQPPVSWGELLTSLLDGLFPQAHNESEAPPVRYQEISRMIANGDLLMAAEALHYEYEQRGKGREFRERIVTRADGRKGFELQPGDAHNELLNLQPRAIVTTNYDRLLERTFGEGFKPVSYYEDSIDDDLRSGLFPILKLHGTAQTPSKTILTRTDFTRLYKGNRLALLTLEALLRTRPFLFLGYSVGDPDLTLILENLFGARGVNSGHYILLPESDVTPERRAVLTQTYGLNIIPLPCSMTFTDALSEFNASVNEFEGDR